MKTTQEKWNDLVAKFHKESGLVKLVTKELGTYEGKKTFGTVRFELILDVSDQPFLDHETYKKGNAYVYFSQKMYDFLTDAVEETFGAEVGWNNTRTTGWVFFNLKSEVKVLS